MCDSPPAIPQHVPAPHNQYRRPRQYRHVRRAHPVGRWGSTGPAGPRWRQGPARPGLIDGDGRCAEPGHGCGQARSPSDRPAARAQAHNSARPTHRRRSTAWWEPGSVMATLHDLAISLLRLTDRPAADRRDRDPAAPSAPARPDRAPSTSTTYAPSRQPARTRSPAAATRPRCWSGSASPRDVTLTAASPVVDRHRPKKTKPWHAATRVRWRRARRRTPCAVGDLAHLDAVAVFVEHGGTLPTTLCSEWARQGWEVEMILSRTCPISEYCASARRVSPPPPTISAPHVGGGVSDQVPRCRPGPARTRSVPHRRRHWTVPSDSCSLFGRADRLWVCR